MSSLHGLKLDLIKTLIAIYEEKTNTKAAKRLFIAPNTVSGSLKKLREVFGDELFIFDHVKTEFVPTEKAKELYDISSTYLHNIDGLITNRDQSFFTSKKCFRVAADCFYISYIHPYLMNLLPMVAPSVTTSVDPLPLNLEKYFIHDFKRFLFGALTSGNLDLVIHSDCHIDDSLKVEVIFRDSMVRVHRSIMDEIPKRTTEINCAMPFYKIPDEMYFDIPSSAVAHQKSIDTNVEILQSEYCLYAHYKNSDETMKVFVDSLRKSSSRLPKAILEIKASRVPVS